MFLKKKKTRDAKDEISKHKKNVLPQACKQAIVCIICLKKKAQTCREIGRGG